ncbi:MAG: isoprenyl transferase [Lachnospiraceae bacterium]|nr:isoprenyl transferase [Lachnospiraceae bacterium]
MNIPKSVAIILDGNGRWAKAKGMPRTYGHIQGAKAVEDICEDAWNLGIEYLTVYAFSTENWNRPEEEVEALMKLLRNYMKNSLKRASKNNMKVRVIGDKSRLADDIRQSIEDLEEGTKNNTGLKFTIAINYGSRDEIRRAVTKIAEEVKAGKIEPSDITEEMIASHLDTAGIMDPDLLIRTCGELRISNFLLWQISYSEIYVTDVPWPDFDKNELIKACESYSGRTRKFGKTAEQIK